MEISSLDIFIRLILSGLLCAFIGFEREYHHRPAGIRTNAITGIATTLMTIVSVQIVVLAKYPEAVDISRIISTILTGIGFIGAGTIIQSKGIVKGLTTAATIWMVAGIGIAVGLGLYKAAVMATILALLILIALRNFPIEDEADAKKNKPR